MIATSGFLTALEYTKFVFGPRWGAHITPADSLAGSRGPTSKGGGEVEGTGRGEGKEGTAPFRKFMNPPLA